MTEDKTAGLIFALGLNDPEHNKRGKEIVVKIAEKKLQLSQIEGGSGGLKIGNLQGGAGGLKIGNIKGGSGGLKIGNIKGGTGGLDVKKIASEHENMLWVAHVDRIVLKHRDIYGKKNEHMPYPLPTKTKMTAAKLFKDHHKLEISHLVTAMKKEMTSKHAMIKAGKGKK